jgi:hypothetical protein
MSDLSSHILTVNLLIKQYTAAGFYNDTLPKICYLEG